MNLEAPHIRPVSKQWLLGVTIGGYLIFSVAVYLFGGTVVSANRVQPGDARVLIVPFLFPGLCVVLLSFLQIYSEKLFHYTPNQRITELALWMNAGGSVGICLAPLKDANQYVVIPVGILILASFGIGSLVSVLNLLWVFMAARSKIALSVAAVLCLSICAWVAYRDGRFTRNLGRHATREGRVILLHPSGATIQIPEEWLNWDAEFHNNLHLSHRELEKVRFASGEWDTEYSEVANAAMPFEYCAAHVGGEGWGSQGVSFGDLQVRAYVTDLSATAITDRISGPAFEAAKKVSARPRWFTADNAKIRSGRDGAWQTAVIQYPLWYGDYGGWANVEFYMRSGGQYQIVLVFMGSAESEKRQILDSFSVPDIPSPPRK